MKNFIYLLIHIVVLSEYYQFGIIRIFFKNIKEQKNSTFLDPLNIIQNVSAPSIIQFQPNIMNMV